LRLELACIVADEMYCKPVSIVALTLAGFATLPTDHQVKVRPEGTVVIRDA
jgi:hypothetical protein